MLEWFLISGAGYYLYKKRRIVKEVMKEVTGKRIIEEEQRKIEKKIEESIKKDSITLENFYFPLFLHVYGRCKERKLCARKKTRIFLLENNSEHNILGVYSDSIEGTSVWLGEDRSIPLARNNFIVVFPSGLNWKEFLLATELYKFYSRKKIELFFKVKKVNEAVNSWLRLHYNTFTFGKFKYFISDNKSDFYVKTEADFDVRGLMVDISVDGALFYVKKGINQHLVYLPWKAINAIVEIGADLSWMTGRESFVEGFSLLLGAGDMVAVIRNDFLGKRNVISYYETSDLEVEEW